MGINASLPFTTTLNAQATSSIYNSIRTLDSSLRNTIRRIATIRNVPTPIPTAYTRTVPFITALTCLASTCRSGSAMVISIPSTKQTISSSDSFFCLDRPAPTWAPIGVIATSAPRLKRPMPTTNNTAPTVKVISSVPVKLNQGVIARTYTIAVIGRVESKASTIFSRSSFKSVTFPSKSHILSYYTRKNVSCQGTKKEIPSLTGPLPIR